MNKFSAGRCFNCYTVDYCGIELLRHVTSVLLDVLCTPGNNDIPSNNRISCCDHLPILRLECANKHCNAHACTLHVTLWCYVMSVFSERAHKRVRATVAMASPCVSCTSAIEEISKCRTLSTTSSAAQ